MHLYRRYLSVPKALLVCASRRLADQDRVSACFRSGGAESIIIIVVSIGSILGGFCASTGFEGDYALVPDYKL